MFRPFLFFLFFFFRLFNSSAQDYFKKTKVNSDLGFIISSTRNSPFLLRSNQFGVVPLESQIGYLSSRMEQEYDSLFHKNKRLKPIGFGYGLNFHLNFGNRNQILIPEGYVKFRFKSIEIYGGRKREIQGLVDTLGTIGSYIWSGNALPLPKIEISIPNYVSVIGKGLISIKGNFAHGWFGKDDSVQNVWLHQKSLYVKLGKSNWKIRMIGGFNHQVQWGGKPTRPFYDPVSKQFISKYGTDFPTFLNVVSGISLSKGAKAWDNQAGIPANEAGNRSGNHLGTIDVGLEWALSSGRLLLYRQSVYDDGSLFYLNNISDGLLGVSYSNLRGHIKNITFEYLNTTNQGGKYFFNQAPEFRGQDNYFTNAIYLDNWTYKNKVIGNSLLDLNSEVNSKNSNFIVGFNNRVSALNLNIFYNFRLLVANTQIVSSRNLGSSNYTIDKNQVSVKQKFNYSYRGLNYQIILGGDFGKFWSNALGLNIGIKRTFR